MKCNGSRFSPVYLFSDNNGAKYLSVNESINRRNKHIDIIYHYVRDVVGWKEVCMQYINRLRKWLRVEIVTNPLRSRCYMCMIGMGLGIQAEPTHE